MNVNREQTLWPVVLLGVGVSAFGAFLQFKLPPVLPAFLNDYPHSADVAAGFMSVLAAVGLLASAPIGRLLERHALLWALLVGLGIATLGIALGLAAPQSGLLMLVARGLEGFTFAIFALIGPVIANKFDYPVKYGRSLIDLCKMQLLSDVLAILMVALL